MQPDALAETQVESGGADKRPQEGPPAAASKSKSFSVSDRMIGRELKGQYRIDALLGQGAMGVVFRGTQLALDKPVAVKMLRPDGFHGDDALDRFAREATLCSKLVHPSIASVLDFGVEDGMPFLVMEFVDGKELTEVLELEGPMAPSRAIAVMRQLASALEEAHRHGVVHRDIKPHNLRLMRYKPGGQLFLKVLDFGIAKQLDSGSQNSGKSGDHHKLTATGAVMGTPAYMPPEQAGGQRIDARADQYATGIVLYELLTGIVPFTGETITGVLMSHMTRPPPPLPKEVPEPLRRVVMRLLEKNAEDRFPDAKALDQALADCEPSCRDVPALPSGKVQPFIAGAKQRKEEEARAKASFLALGAGALLLSLLILGGVLYWGLTKRPNPPPSTPASLVALTGPTKGPEAGGTPVATLPSEVKPEGKPDVKPEVKVAVKPEVKPAEVKPEVKIERPGPPSSNVPTKPESPEVKEQLDEAESLLAKESYEPAIDLARRSTFISPTGRAYKLLVKAYCNMGNLEGAKTAFRRTTAADRGALVKLCKKHDIDLP